MTSLTSSVSSSASSDAAVADINLAMYKFIKSENLEEMAEAAEQLENACEDLRQKRNANSSTLFDTIGDRLVAKAHQFYMESEAPDKFTLGNKIVTIVQKHAAPTPELASTVNQALKVWAENRLVKADAELSQLENMQNLLDLTSRYVEDGAEGIQAQKKMDAHKGKIKAWKDRNGNQGWCIESPTKQELSNLLASPYGFALLLKMPKILGPVTSEEYTEEDRAFFRNYLAQAKHDPDDFITANFFFLEKMMILNRYSQSYKKLIDFAKLIDIHIQPWHTKTAPNFVEFLKGILDGRLLNQGNSAHPRFPKYLQEQYKKLKAIESEKQSLIDAYRRTYEEFELLKKKCPQEKMLFTISNRTYPTPDAFASGFGCIKTLELLEPRAPSAAAPKVETHAAAAAKKKKKHNKKKSAGGKSVPGKPATEPVSKTAAPVSSSSAPSLASSLSLTPTVENTPVGRVCMADSKESKSDGKENKEESKKKAGSIFAGRDFPFKKFHYDKRVSEKRGDWRHDFFSYVDNFVGTAYSQKGTWDKKPGHVRYAIPAEIQHKNGKPVRGTFHYTFDGNGVCYHRFFHEKSNDEILQAMLTKTLFEADFPTLQKSFETFSSKRGSITEGVFHDEIPYEIDVLDSVTLRDPLNDLVIRLFKIGNRSSAAAEK